MTGSVGEPLLEGGEDLDPLDRVDAEVGVELHVRLEHLGRVARLLRHDLQQDRLRSRRSVGARGDGRCGRGRSARTAAGAGDRGRPGSRRGRLGAGATGGCDRRGGGRLGAASGGGRGGGRPGRARRGSAAAAVRAASGRSAGSGPGRRGTAGAGRPSARQPLEGDQVLLGGAEGLGQERRVGSARPGSAAAPVGRRLGGPGRCGRRGRAVAVRMSAGCGRSGGFIVRSVSA